MKTLLKFLSVFFVTQLFLYSFFSFVLWEYNPKKWGIDIRFYFVMSGFLFGLMSIILTIDFLTKNK